MAQLKEGSIIKKSTGDEVIATINDIPETSNIPTKTSELENDSNFLTDMPIHNHDDLYYTESEVNTLLSSKAESSTVSGHTGNSTVHVTSTDKNNWNDKANLSDIPTPYVHPSTHPYSMLTGVPSIPTTTSQLTNNSGFITIASVPPPTPHTTIGIVKPTDGSMWYEVI